MFLHSKYKAWNSFSNIINSRQLRVTKMVVGRSLEKL